jgi:hypothetical protein
MCSHHAYKQLHLKNLPASSAVGNARRYYLVQACDAHLAAAMHNLARPWKKKRARAKIRNVINHSMHFPLPPPMKDGFSQSR